MDKPQKRPPSLREFDYFDDRKPSFEQAPPASQDGPGPHGLSGSADAPQTRRVQPRRWVSLALTAVFLAFAVWFAWQFRDYAEYAFAPPDEPLRLGSVTDLSPDMMPHNAYVSVHGITEHRGLQAQTVRGLTLHHDEYWYFRLMGSRGVFIEVAPDPNTYGPNTEVTVQGRVMDPDKDPLYTALLKSYEDTFVTELRAHRRLIQVGLKPGEGRARYTIAGAVLVACVALFTLNGWRTLRGLIRA